jgi:hypothetical protein
VFSRLAPCRDRTCRGRTGGESPWLTSSQRVVRVRRRRLSEHDGHDHAGRDSERQAVHGPLPPPEGFEFLHHWARADGRGGVFIAEAASAAAILEATAPWGPNLDFDIAPLVDITEAVPTFLKVQEWAKSVS